MQSVSTLGAVIFFAAIISSCSTKEKKVYVRPDETDPVWECAVASDSTSREVQVEAIDNNTYITALTHTVCGINSERKELWRKEIIAGKYGTDIVALNPSGDGNFIIGGNAQDTANATMYGWLAKISPSGEIVWQNAFPLLPGFDDIIIAANGDIAATGLVSETFYLSRFKANGELLWNNFYPGVSYNGKGITNTPEGGFLMAAESDLVGTGFHTRLLKTDAAGKLLWSNVYKIDQGEIPEAVFADSLGNFMVVGVSSDTISKDGIFTLKVNSEGKQISATTKYWEDDVPDVIHDVKQTAKGNYILCGDLFNFRMPRRLMMAELDMDGNIVWIRSIPRKDGRRGGASLAILPDGSLLGLGYSVSLEQTAQPGDGASLIKIPANGGTARKADY